MDPIEAFWRIIENQGIVAGVLLIKMWQSSKFTAQLLRKNCEMNKFLMQCLQREIDEDHNMQNGSVATPKTQEAHDLRPGASMSFYR